MKRNIGKILTVSIALLIALLAYLFVATKEWRYEVQGKAMLLQATNEKLVLVEQARAERDSAEFKKQADIKRAEGIAEANRIINESLTDEYVRWLYVENLKETSNQVIYLPTEAGLPILESNRIK